ncbi:hypothetical protein [Blautia sp.]|uniref:Uncharacterized protein n=1 Tax=Blautia glucerasea TaxID=536633 RepID=A0A6N2QV85_9FIRM
MDYEMTDIIAIISSIIAVGYSIYSIVMKGYIRQYNLKKFEHFSLNQKKALYCFQFYYDTYNWNKWSLYIAIILFLMGLKTLL